MSTRWADGGTVQADPRLVSRPAGRPAPRWLRIAFPVLLGAIVLAMFVMPQLLRLLPDRPAIPVAGLAGQVSGTFVTSGGAMFKLYPYPENLPKFPAKAAVAGTNPLLYIRARQLSEQRLYYLSTWPGLRPVPVRRSQVDPHTLRLAAVATLAPGRYVITAAQDSADADFDYFYFRVTPATH